MTITINHFLVVSFLLFSIGLALTISLFRQRRTLNVEDANTMQG